MPQPVRPVEAPPRDKWSRVLRRYDRDPRLPWRFASYAVNIEAQPVLMDGKVAPSLFFPPTTQGIAAAKRAAKLGWKDETDAFLAWLGTAAPVPPPPEAPHRLLTGEALVQYIANVRDYNELRAMAKNTTTVSGRLTRDLLEPALVEHFESIGGLRVPLEE